MLFRKSEDKIVTAGYLCIVFVFFFIFFSQLHPVVISDTDDWWYTYVHRDAVPLWNNWNPSRVFPEVFMPLVSAFGAYVLYPVIHDYFHALTVSYAIVLAASISFLTYSLIKYLITSFSAGKKTSVLISILFLLSHFWVFRIHESGNDYFFRAVNACTYFYYVIPNLLCASFTLLFLSTANDRKGQGHISLSKLSVIIIGAYFCIFSNIWASLIIGAYVAGRLSFRFFSMLRSGTVSIRHYIIEQKIDLVLLSVWVTAQVFELSGERAGSISNQSFLSEIKTCIITLYDQLTQINRAFLLFMGAILFWGILILIKHSTKTARKHCILLFLSTAYAALYLILSCSKTGAGYLTRTDVIYSCFFFVLLIVLICLSEIIKKHPVVKSVLPLLFFIAFINCNTTDKTYLESNICQFEPELWNRVNTDIMDQFISADESGESEIILYVPFFPGQDNWPLATYAAKRFSENFYKMNITVHKITVTEMVPSPEKNASLSITAKYLES